VAGTFGGKENQISGCCKEKAGNSVQPFGKFSKDGSVIACMKRKQKPVATLGKKTKVGV
jgi:hypothetical protein